MLTFFDPMFLWALAAAAVPLLLHLLQRRKTVRVLFPTLRFLKLAERRSASRIRLENLLLWLVRTLLIVVLALAFAAPVLRNSAAAKWAGSNRRDIVLVFDVSYSMGYETGRGTVMDVAKEAALELLNSLAPDDRVCIYLTGVDKPVPLIEKPTSDHALVLRLLREIQWQPETSAIEPALSLAHFNLSQQKELGRDREYFLLTDGQSLPWRNKVAAASLPPIMDADGGRDAAAVFRKEKLFILAAGVALPENTWIASATVTPVTLLERQTARAEIMLGRVGNSRDITLALDIDGMEDVTRAVTLNADAPTTVEIPVPELPEGLHLLRFRITPDALPVDDSFIVPLRVIRKLPAAVSGSDTRFLRAALDPSSTRDTVTTLSPDELGSANLDDIGTVFLADAFPLSGQAQLALEAFVRRGGALAVFPGGFTTPQHYASWALLPAGVRDIQRIPVDEALRALHRLNRDDGIFENFRFPRGVIPTVALKRTLVFDSLREDTETILSAGDDLPFLLMRREGLGKVFAFSVSADREWSTFPLTAFFVPIVHQVLRSSAVSAPATVQEVLGRELTPFEEFSASRERDESFLDTALAHDLETWSGFEDTTVVRTPEELMITLDIARKGKSLAEIFLWGALLLALVEFWLSNRTLRQPTHSTNALASRKGN